MIETRHVAFAEPDITRVEIDAVTEVLRSRWLSTGPHAERFEAEMASAHAVRFALATNSCTAALHLALVASGIGPGDEVVVPALTFSATAAAVEHAGAQPVIVDVESDSMALSPATVAGAIGPKTKAIIPVHFGGRMADVRGLRDLAAAHGLVVIEDAAHALPAERDGARPGQCGNAAAFSFFASKTITTGEGGMLVSDDEALIARARVLGAHGIERNGGSGYRPGQSSTEYDVVAAGFKYNMSDLQAALGSVQLGRAQALRQRRSEIAIRYTDAFAANALLQCPLGDEEGVASAWYLYVLRLSRDLAHRRDFFRAELASRGVETSVHFTPLPHYSHWRTARTHPPDVPCAFDEFARSVSLPIRSTMTDADVDHVVGSVSDVIASIRS